MTLRFTSAVDHAIDGAQYPMHPITGLLVYLFFCVLVGFAADRTMYRSFFGWTILAFFFSPLVAFIFLQVAGPPLIAANQVSKYKEAIRQRDIADDEYRADDTCPSCGSPINFVTHQGIESPEDEPWRVFCVNCEQEIDEDQLLN
jgi:hypothetical protein